MSTFEPDTVIAILQNTVEPNKRKEFEKTWRNEVEDRWKGWKKKRSTQSQYQPQLEWEAHIVQYVNFVHKLTKLHGSSKNVAGANLRKDVPLFGPRFVPPGYLQVYKRKTSPEIEPDITYVKSLHIIHPFYYPELAQCPQCDSEDIQWNGWTTTGHREVHGISREETALGYQLRCKPCESQYRSRIASGGVASSEGDATFCFCTTNHMFWERREHWEIPRQF
ncbi:hypothetical protein B0H21DRAFT_775664 [Amylocystis lapponica]|nr:hypothetical protein B0H21DRAFT_775664 [Amylocystis lapponica]